MIALVAIAVAVATSAACSSGDSSGAAEETDGWGIDLSSMIADAEAAGATPEQIAVLEDAQETGEVSFEVYSAAVDRALRCIREAGGRAYDQGVDEDQGILWRTYSVETEAREADPVEFWPGMTMHRCVAEHSFAVETAYRNQPSSMEKKEAFWERHRETIVACLHEEGFDDVVGDEPMSELKRIAAEAVVEGRSDRDCLNVADADEGAES